MGKTAAVSAAQYRLSWTGTGHTQTPGRKLQRSARGRGADPSQDLGMRGGVIGGTGSLGTDREGRQGSLEQIILNQHIIIEDTPPPLPPAPPQSHTNLKEFISPRWRDWRTWRNKGGCGTQNRRQWKQPPRRGLRNSWRGESRRSWSGGGMRLRLRCLGEWRRSRRWWRSRWWRNLRKEKKNNWEKRRDER